MHRQKLLTAAQAFCSSFANNADIESILSHFSTAYQITAIEHGDPALAPFIGRPFVGAERIKVYFETISSLLSYDQAKFSQFVVDSETSRVACKGHAKFTWLSTDESWEETFAYMLDFDDEYKVTDYQIWADSGSAYLARLGKLSDIRKE